MVRFVAFLQQLEKTIASQQLLRDGERVLIGVSGGVDSMVLLHALYSLFVKHGWKLSVAHFNHQLRGRSSDADERLVCRTAKQLKLPMFVGTRNVKSVASRKKISIEMAARQLRHSFFAGIAKKHNIRVVALAHHADDQVELFFLRLLRGAGMHGLGGMRLSSPSPADAKICLVRPLLDFSKKDLLAFAIEHRVAFREDATNAQLDYARNQVRHTLMPLIEKLQPSAAHTITRTMDVIRAETDFVREAADGWLAAKRKEPFERLAVAVQRRCIELQLPKFDVHPTFDLVEHLRTSPGIPLSIRPNLWIERNASGEITVSKRATGFSSKEIVLDIETGKTADFGGCRISMTVLSKSGRSLRREAGVEFFDADEVGRRIVLRHWQPGDRFQPIGMQQPVKLQDLFTNQKVPKDRRHRVVVAEAENGDIFWVENLRISDQFKLTEATKRRLKWCFSRSLSVVAAEG